MRGLPQRLKWTRWEQQVFKRAMLFQGGFALGACVVLISIHESLVTPVVIVLLALIVACCVGLIFEGRWR